MIELAREEKEDKRHIPVATIKVVGVGGAGGNTIDCMVQSDYKDVEFIAVNTDAQALKLSKAHKTLQIGQKSTKGLGAGANPEIGKRAAEEDLDKVLSELHDADIVFLAAGMGGGTGSGAAPVIVKALKEKGILTIVVLTRPFDFEGRKRSIIANTAIEEIQKHADTLLIVPNQKLLDVVDDQVSMIEGFEMINEVMNQSVKGVSDIITRAGHINVDFADVREIMRDQGLAVMGTGKASGEDRARKAAISAISSPLLENMSIAGAHGVLLNISGNSALGLHEISSAASVIYDQADPNANIILGSVIDDNLGEDVSVTVIATGFDEHPATEVKVQGTVLAKEPEQKAVQKKQQQKEKRTFNGDSKNETNTPQEEIAPETVESINESETPVQPNDPEELEEVSENSESIPGTEDSQGDNNVNKLASKEREQSLARQQITEQKIDRVPEGKQQSSGLGSNVIQVKDLDVPTFMRKQNTEQHSQEQPQQYSSKRHKKHKKNKHKHHQQYEQHRPYEK